MSHQLLELLTQNISVGLKRKAITTPSRWAENYRIMGPPFPGPFNFKYFPWLREIHDSKAEKNVCKKSAQAGFTETALDRCFFTLDILGLSVLYVLPASKPDAADFSTTRFDNAIEMSPRLQELFDKTQNVGLKRVGNANLYIRGSRSPSQLKSIPVSTVILDELDEMTEDNVQLVFERQSGQNIKNTLLLSTPTIENYGIDAEYRNSTQEKFYFRCPHCSRYINLEYPRNLIIVGEDFNNPDVYDSYLTCHECKNTLEHRAKPDYLASGKWVSDTDSKNPVRGFYINQMYSSTVTPGELAIQVLKSQFDVFVEQELYRSKFGLAYIPKGAKLSLTDLKNSVSSYPTYNEAPNGSFCVMGVDVGNWLHFEITHYAIDRLANDININSYAKVLKADKVLAFEELDTLMHDFNIRFCVIDAQPERRKALEFARRFPGRVRLCFYPNSVNGKNITLHAEEDASISVDRTTWLDMSLGRFKTDRISLPQDISFEYKEHLQTPSKTYRKDSNGNPVAVYVSGNKADHFAHARNYCEIALPLAAAMASNVDLTDIL